MRKRTTLRIIGPANNVVGRFLVFRWSLELAFAPAVLAVQLMKFSQMKSPIFSPA